jgi:hypothetical protein
MHFLRNREAKAWEPCKFMDILGDCPSAFDVCTTPTLLIKLTWHPPALKRIPRTNDASFVKILKHIFFVSIFIWISNICNRSRLHRSWEIWLATNWRLSCLVLHIDRSKTFLAAPTYSSITSSTILEPAEHVEPFWDSEQPGSFPASRTCSSSNTRLGVRCSVFRWLKHHP